MGIRKGHIFTICTSSTGSTEIRYASEVERWLQTKIEPAERSTPDRSSNLTLMNGYGMFVMIVPYQLIALRNLLIVFRRDKNRRVKATIRVSAATPSVENKRKNI